MTTTDVPEWLRLMRDRQQPQPTPPALRPAPAGAGTPYGQAALAAELGRVRAATAGSRNDTLNKATFALGQLVAGGELPEDVWDDVLSAALSAGLPEAEARRTMRSAISAAGTLPRSAPPPPATATGPRDVRPVGTADADDSFDALPECLDWHQLWADETEDEWIVEPILPAHRLVALFSAPKVGKSLLMLELAAGIAAGRGLLGQPAQTPRRVLYVDYENDPRGDVRERLQAMGHHPDELDRLRYLSYPVLGGLDTPYGAARLIAVAEREAVDVVCIDTVSRAIEGEENANDTWLAFYRRTGLALKRRGISLIRLDHSGKDEERGMRGGSAKYGDVDAVWRLRQIGENTLTLECTHRRMRIVESFLTLRRLDEPLRHEVDAGGRASAHDVRTQRLVDALDELGVPTAVGRPAAKEALRAAGVAFRSDDLAAALRRRKSPLDAYLEELE